MIWLWIVLGIAGFVFLVLAFAVIVLCIASSGYSRMEEKAKRKVSGSFQGQDMWD